MAHRKAIPPFERILRRSSRAPLGYSTDCLIWQGSKDHGGYGKIEFGSMRSHDRRTASVHRAAWEHHHGSVPAGMQVDHLCCDPSWCAGGRSCPHRACAEITHLALASKRDNVLRGNSVTGVNARKTRCAHGHEFTLANTHLRPDGSRECRTCSGRTRA